jgi:RNA polymerase sigma-70 factor, ECF subfamily
VAVEGFNLSRKGGFRVSYGEPIALRGDADLEQVASAAPGEVRSVADEQFLERLRRGEAAAFERLVADRAAEVYALLYRLTADVEEARDLTQETFLRAFQSMARFRGDADLKTWLYRIAVNQARNRWRWWRRRRRDATVSLDAQDNWREQPFGASLANPDAPNPEDETLAREREARLHDALHNLKRPHREAVILRDIEGFTYEEIAATLEISIGTVKSRLSRGRLELRRKLEGSL